MSKLIISSMLFLAAITYVQAGTAIAGIQVRSSEARSEEGEMREAERYRCSARDGGEFQETREVEETYRYGPGSSNDYRQERRRYPTISGGYY